MCEIFANGARRRSGEPRLVQVIKVELKLVRLKIPRGVSIASRTDQVRFPWTTVSGRVAEWLRPRTLLIFYNFRIRFKPQARGNMFFDVYIIYPHSVTKAHFHVKSLQRFRRSFKVQVKNHRDVFRKRRTMY
jgi:hypothetical protein